MPKAHVVIVSPTINPMSRLWVALEVQLASNPLLLLSLPPPPNPIQTPSHTISSLSTLHSPPAHPLDTQVLLASSVASVTAEGGTGDLLRGFELGDALLNAEEVEGFARKEAMAASAAMMELGQVTHPPLSVATLPANPAEIQTMGLCQVDSSEKEGAKEAEARKKAERRVAEAQKRVEECAATLWQCRLNVLVAKSSQLLSFEMATCTSANDRAAIKVCGSQLPYHLPSTLPSDVISPPHRPPSTLAPSGAFQASGRGQLPPADCLYHPQVRMRNERDT